MTMSISCVVVTMLGLWMIVALGGRSVTWELRTPATGLRMSPMDPTHDLQSGVRASQPQPGPQAKSPKAHAQVMPSMTKLDSSQPPSGYGSRARTVAVTCAARHARPADKVYTVHTRMRSVPYPSYQGGGTSLMTHTDTSKSDPDNDHMCCRASHRGRL